MPGINQLPAGAEWAAAISLTWATTSLICSSLLLWLTWAHSEGRSYLALLSISSLFSNLFSIIQQCRDVTWYVDIQSEAFERKLSLPADDPELAISDGSFGMDLVLYYLQYYLYNVQALLVMFWAAELCQLTYQIGERRNMRRLLRNLHMAGKIISWLLPMITIACLQVSSLKESFVAFILIADLPLMISLAMGSGLMIAVLIRYIHTRQRFTHWNPPKFSSTTNSEAGTTTASSRQNTGGRRGLYDRWLMVRFTIAFVLLAVFEVTNTLFQITALKNNIHDAQKSAPDLSTARAVQTLFLDMPGTTPGIFIFVVFGTTASSRAKLADLLVPAGWRENTRGCFRLGSRQASTPPVRDPLTSYDSGIHVQRSLTITSTRRGHMSYFNDEDLDSSDTGDVFLTDLPKRPESTASVYITRVKPLPLAMQPPSSKFKAVATSATDTLQTDGWTTTRTHELPAIREKHTLAEELRRTSTDDSLRVPSDYQTMGSEHSDDSGPILPIQRQEVRFSRDVSYVNRAGSRTSADKWQSKNFSRPKK